MTRPKNIFDLQKLPTFEERFEYLACNAPVGAETFGYDRWVNQKFYKSRLWRNARDQVIIRDNGCDLGVPGYEIQGKIYIHHMNPITIDDIIDDDYDMLSNPKFLVCVSFETHQALHYGDISLVPEYILNERLPGDTTLW